MTASALRPLLSTAATALVLSSVALAGAPSAFAAPGDDGDIKVHNAGPNPPRTPENDERNVPQVCPFYFAAFNFNDIVPPSIHWDIYNQPQPGNAVLSGNIALDSNGDGHSIDLTLPDGMYKVEVTWPGQQGAKKSKVFRVECATPPPTNPPTNPPTTGGNNGGNGHHKPPHGPVGAGGGGAADSTGTTDDGSAFGVGSALAAGLAGTAGLILIRRSRRRDNGVA
ncbi:hypothetical protein [Streptomyces sp. NPDC053431]|uniref:hypothetical protein n=1 Tax=Streptomyces sp. NPDC053431 TaxID=3365703 RepID=UPI0037D32817